MFLQLKFFFYTVYLLERIKKKRRKTWQLGMQKCAIIDYCLPIESL